MITSLICAFAGGALGALARVKLAEKFDSKTGFPFGTLSANSISSFMLGILISVFDRWNAIEWLQYLLDFGFCATLSTFSSLAWQIAHMLSSKRYSMAATYASVSLASGLILFVSAEYLAFAMLFSE